MPDSIDLGSYSVFVPPDPFEDHVGPFYFRIRGDAREAGSVHCVLPTHERHGNYVGGDAHVASRRHLETGAQGVALAAGDDGHRTVTDGLAELVDLGEEREIDGTAVFGVSSMGVFFAMAPAEQVKDFA